MFDAPVLEVTVSSAPITIANSLSDSNPVALVALSKPQVSSALLNALAVLPKPANASSDIDGETGESAISSTPTLFSKATFQGLEPLNLANKAKSLETVFALPLTLNSPSEPATDNLLKASSPESAATDVETTPTDSNSQAPTAIAIKPAATASPEPAKAPPEEVTMSLRQCLDSPPSENQGITTFQVIRQGTAIGEASELNSTDQAVTFLKETLKPEEIVPHEIAPVLSAEKSAIRLSGDVLLQVVNPTEQDASPGEETSELNSEWAAITWSNELRQALGATPLDPGNVQVILKGLQPTGEQLNGLASWYGPYFHGRLTANGEIFDQNAMTAAHKSLPFDTVLQVRNPKTNRSVVVRINDRGPYIGKRSLDLSKAAAQCLGSETEGILSYEAIFLAHPPEAAPHN